MASRAVHSETGLMTNCAGAATAAEASRAATISPELQAGVIAWEGIVNEVDDAALAAAKPITGSEKSAQLIHASRFILIGNLHGKAVVSGKKRSAESRIHNVKTV